MAISYGAFNFPPPLPLFIIGDEPIYVAGELDSSLTKITLIGTITGSGLSSLSSSKNTMITGLLSEYQTLTVDSEIFNCCKPSSINFSDSDLTTILPYSIEFERYDEKSFSQYYGILNPINTWSYQEQDGRVVQATHSVSAQGVKTGAFNPLEAAKAFVDSKISGFESLSIINPSATAFLISKSEEIDRFLNSYSVTENYSFSTSRNPITNSGIVSATTQVNYVKGGDSTVAVNGSIFGTMTGSDISTGMFTPSNATTLAFDAIQNSKSIYEETIYDVLAHGPTSYNYNINPKANKIDFTFQFKDPFNLRTNNVINDYSVSISASKDDNVITATIEGTLTYEGPFDIYISGAIESSPRYLEILDEFNSLDFYSLAFAKYTKFISGSNYDISTYLNPNAVTESTTKSPYIPSISYSFSYNNKEDYGNGLLNVIIDLTDNLPIKRTEFLESNGGFASQETVTKTLGRIQASASSSNSGSSFTYLSQACKNLMAGKLCQIFEESSGIADSSINYSVSSYY